MSDPKRLLAGGANELEARLLRSWKADRPSSTAKRAAIVAGTAIVAATSATTSAAGAAAGTGVSASKTLFLGANAWLAGAVMAVTAGVVGISVHASAPPAPSAEALEPRVAPITSLIAPAPVSSIVPEVPAPSTPDPPLPVVSSVVPVAPAPPRNVHPIAPTTPGKIATTPDPSPAVETENAPEGLELSKQITVLDEARAALTSGDAPATLRVVDRYEQDYPNGLLKQEAMFLRIAALVHQGDRASAKREATHFFAAYPTSPHNQKIRQLIESNP